MKKILQLMIIFTLLPQLLFAGNIDKKSNIDTHNLPPLLAIYFNHSNISYNKQLAFLIQNLPKKDIKLHIEAKFAVDEKKFTQDEFKQKIEDIIKKLMAKGLTSQDITIKAVRTNLVTVSEIKISRIF